MSKGSLGSEPMTEYQSCISSSIFDRSRSQNLLRICQVEEEKEEDAFG